MKNTVMKRWGKKVKRFTYSLLAKELESIFLNLLESTPADHGESFTE